MSQAPWARSRSALAPAFDLVRLRFAGRHASAPRYARGRTGSDRAGLALVIGEGVRARVARAQLHVQGLVQVGALCSRVWKPKPFFQVELLLIGISRDQGAVHIDEQPSSQDLARRLAARRTRRHRRCNSIRDRGSWSGPRLSCGKISLGVTAASTAAVSPHRSSSLRSKIPPTCWTSPFPTAVIVRAWSHRYAACGERS